MNREQYLALDRAAHLTAEQASVAVPELADYLRRAIAEERRRRVLSQFAGASKPLLETLTQLDSTRTAERPDAASVVRSALRQPGVAPALAREANARLSQLERSGGLTDDSADQVPTRAMAAFQENLQRARVYKRCFR